MSAPPGLIKMVLSQSKYVASFIFRATRYNPCARRYILYCFLSPDTFFKHHAPEARDEVWCRV